ncbi:unnamed protein product [Tilletia controversa]|uniref:MI domain-containing protein n=1 Tax=Tilletia controversa TaxID=13291 RepID=A0A8X7T0A7_9BASI|nr:hypothetical protein A4X06_0g1290 [Tilletia controversa]CAD6912941.1 unnamed protein product [Tilletia controversa]CAD6915250.1 unnamed protein product [Tilletia controversa]
MSKANTPNTFTNKPQAASAAATGASAPASRPTSAFNYAAAAAKSKPAATSFAAAAAAGVSSASQASSGAATPTTTGASTPGPSQQQQQQSASSSSSATPATAIPVPQNGSRPQGSSGALVNGAPQSSHNRRQSAVSVAKGQSGTLPIAVKSAGSRDSINFGSIAEANALLSSSPAAVPEAIRQPRQFGTVEAAKPDPNMNGGAAGNAAGDAAAQKASAPGSDATSAATPAVRTAKPNVNFHKLFQSSGPSSSSVPSSSTATSTTAGSSRPASGAASTQTATPSSSVVTTPAASQQSTPAHTPASLNATPSPAQRMPSSNLRPNGSQPFQPARTASGQHSGPGSRLPSGTPGNVPPSPFVPHNQQQQSQQQQQQQQPQGMQGQVQRSPNVQHAGLQPMHMGQQSWVPMYPAGAQYPGYQPHYGYQGPGGWQQPHQGYDMQGGASGAPRSPRHPNMPSSPMPPINGVPAASPMHSPGQTRTQPAGQGGIGIGQPPTPHTPHQRPPSFPSVGSGTFVPHGHAHGHTHSGSQHGSFSGPGGPNSPLPGGMAPMSPSARNFEPKRSSAIRIVDPNTKAALDLTGLAPKTVPASVSKFLANASGTGASTPGSSSGAPSPIPAPAVLSKPKTHDNFMEKVRSKLAAGKAESKVTEDREKADKEEAEKKAKDEAEQKAKKEEEDRKVKEEDERKAKEEAERKAKEAEEVEKEAKRKAEEEAKLKQKKDEEEAETKRKAEEETKRKAEEEESKRKAEEETKRKQEEEAAATATADAAAKKKQQEEAEAASAEQSKSTEDQAQALAKETTPTRPAPRPIETKGSYLRGGFSSADIEKLAREASSVPSTPHHEGMPRTPGGMPLATPRTPSTPGFAGLPAKPMSSLTSATSSGSIASIGNQSTIKLDLESLEKRKRPIVNPLDVSAANKVKDDGPLSAASVSLGSARRLHNLERVDYGKMLSPKPELNEDAAPGKYRYDRDFLLQFMDVVKDKPPALPSLSALGMDNASIAAMPPRTGSGRRASGIVGGPGSAIRAASTGLGIMGPGSAFGGKGGAPPKTSEERFAASSMRPAGAGATGSFGSGPMGAFNVGNRSQPLSRGGSGSNALPGRDDGRTKSTRGRQRDPNPSRGGHGGIQVNPPDKGGPTIPLDQVVPLTSSENRWMPQASRSTVKADSPEMVQRKVKALLNKLTLEKFESISTQILEWANKSVNETDGRTLRQVIALIFEKATDEASFSEMYARLCQKIYGELNPAISDANLNDQSGAPVAGGLLFRKYLLNRCQEDFERGWAARESSQEAAEKKKAEDLAKQERNKAAEEEAKAAAARGEEVKTEEKDAELLSEEYYELAKAKRRGLGLVRFIGELCKKAMLTERIMHHCVKQLLANTTEPEEEDIESLCKLLTTVGQMMDSPKYTGLMDIYFQRMHDIVDSGKINSRMRYMLVDVIELREKQKWIPRRAQANTGPKTIAQVHEEAKAQAQAKEAEHLARSRGGPVSRGGSRRGQPREGYGPGPGGPGGDGWATVGGGAPAPPPPRAKAGDLSGFGSITRTSSKGPLFGGPSNVFGKKLNKGPSEDGSTPPTRTNSSQNMFALLKDTEDTDGTPTPVQETAEGGRPKLKLAPRTLPLEDSNAPAAAGEGAEAEAEGAKDEDEGPAAMTDDEASKRIANDVKEFLEVKDVKSGVEGFTLLPVDRRSQAIAEFVDAAINKKEADVQNVTKLFHGLSEDSVVTEDQAADALKDTVTYLQDFEIDAPNAFTWIAGMLVALGLPRSRVEALAESMENEDNASPSPKEKLLAKFDERISA